MVLVGCRKDQQELGAAVILVLPNVCFDCYETPIIESTDTNHWLGATTGRHRGTRLRISLERGTSGHDPCVRLPSASNPSVMGMRDTVMSASQFAIEAIPAVG